MIKKKATFEISLVDSYKTEDTFSIRSTQELKTCTKPALWMLIAILFTFSNMWKQSGCL
jgi:hypothetical protein